jgi:hypothetical protein
VCGSFNALQLGHLPSEAIESLSVVAFFLKFDRLRVCFFFGTGVILFVLSLTRIARDSWQSHIIERKYDKEIDTERILP